MITLVAALVLLAIVVLVTGAYGLYPVLCRHGVAQDEARAPLPGDDLVGRSTTGYTLAVSVAAPPDEVWPWLVQMGQGRAGFYTHQWVERLLGADIENAERIRPELQRIAVGDIIRLTPDPYVGKPGQKLCVAGIEPGSALVLGQVLPDGSTGSWAFVLRPGPACSTRLLFRRRGEHSSAFDRVMTPGYYFMDRGMLAGIKKRAESARTHQLHVDARAGQAHG